MKIYLLILKENLIFFSIVFLISKLLNNFNRAGYLMEIFFIFCGISLIEILTISVILFYKKAHIINQKFFRLFLYFFNIFYVIFLFCIYKSTQNSTLLYQIIGFIILIIGFTYSFKENK